MDRMLPVAEFTTAALTPLARYEAWRDLISAVFEPALPDGHQRHDLRAEVSSAHFGQVLLVNATAEAQHFSRSRRLIATENLDHYLIQVYRSGVCDGTYGEVQNTVRPGDIKIIDLAQTFRTFNTDFANITLTVPRTALAPLLDRPDAMHGIVLPREAPLARVIAAHIQELSTLAPQLTPIEGAALAAGTVRLVGACLGANPRSRDETRSYRLAAMGQAVRDFIGENVASPLLGPDLLARRFNMSRAQLYRLFAGEGGVAAYIQARRLKHCFLAITDPGQSRRRIGEIAFEVGFSSDAHFSHAFRRAFGMTPSEARAGAGLVRPPSRDTFINDWMRGLRRGIIDDLVLN